MSDPQKAKNSSSHLPEALRSQLKEFRGQVWRIKITEAVLAGFFGLIFSYTLVFALDRVFATPGWLRLLILLVGVSVFALFAPLWINRWVFNHRRENQLANLISKRYPHLGDRLLGIVELQDQDEANTSLSPRLREAAMSQVAAEIKAKDLQTALPHSAYKKWSLAVIGLAILTFSLCSVFPKAGFNAMQRWLMPLADIERYTETVIDPSSFQNPLHVAHGEPFNFSFSLTEDSKVPSVADARDDISPWQQATEQDLSYSFSFPKAMYDKKLQVRVGDAFTEVTVKPVSRPTLKTLVATIHYPEYLQKEDESIDLTSGQASIIQGSEITISGTINRPLTSASATQTISSSTDQKNAPATFIDYKIAGKSFHLQPLTIQHDQITIPLTWTDHHSLTNTPPTVINIEQEIDSVPTSYFQNIAKELYILADSAIQFEAVANDDFGLKSMGISWQGSFSTPTPHAPAKGSIEVAQGDPQRTSLQQTIDFSFPTYDIKPQKLSLRVWAEDYKTDHARSYSEPITIYLLSRAEHREYLEQLTRTNINKLEDLMREEQGLLDENRRLERKDGESLQKPENRDKLAEQSQKEQENASAMKEISEQMERIFKEAASNPDIDSNTMKKLAQSALKMKEMAQQKMPSIAKKLDESQSAENTEDKTKKDVQEAVAQQSELLKLMEDTIQEASEANKQLEAGTFVSRLQKAAGDEELLANSLIEAIKSPKSETIQILSRSFDELDPSDQRSIIDFYALQKQTGTDVNWIQEDLSHFILRTQQEEHKELLGKMRASKISEDMQTLLSNIEKNHNYRTIDLSKKSAETLRQWAKALQNAASKNQAGGGGGASPPSEDEDFEFMLKVLRITQQEIGIRAKIRSLEQKKRLLNASPPVNSTKGPL